MSKPKAVVSWSGGKDSYLALHRAISSFDVQSPMSTEDGARSRSHGLCCPILSASGWIPAVSAANTTRLSLILPV
jgi:hypothetical protein